MGVLGGSVCAGRVCWLGRVSDWRMLVEWDCATNPSGGEQ